MKKTIALLLALLFVTGALFAEVIEIGTGTSGSTSYDMYLQAIVQEGGGLDNGDGEDPDDIVNDGLYIMVGYNRINSSGYKMGSTYATRNLENLGSYTKARPLTVSLTPENADDKEGTLQFYVAAKSNSSLHKTTTVSFSSDGFTKQAEGDVGQQADDPIKITFKGIEALTSATNGLSATHEVVTTTAQTALTEEADSTEPGIKVTVEAGSHQKEYIYVARTDATWIKSSDYAAGTYNATITVTVATE